MRFEQLRYFDSAVRHKSLRQAALALGIAQPSLSDQIQRLEEDLGVVLLVRGPAGVRPTEAALAMLPHLHAALRAEDAMRQEASAITGLRTGRVRLGAVTTASQGFLIGVVLRFQHDLPGISFQVTEAGSIEIQDKVVAGDLDVGVVSRFADETETESALRYIDLAEGRLVLQVPKGNALARRRGGITGADIAAHPVIAFYPRYMLRAALDRLTDGHEVRPVYLTDSAETAVRLVSSGVGVSIASTLRVARSLPNVETVPIKAAWATIHMSAVLRRDEQPSPAVNAFLRLARAEIASRPPG